MYYKINHISVKKYNFVHRFEVIVEGGAAVITVGIQPTVIVHLSRVDPVRWTG